MLSLCFICRSQRIIFNYKTWFIVDVAIMNSASVVDYATIPCFFKHHEKTHEPRLKQYYEVLHMSSIDRAQSLSENLYSLKFRHFSNLTP